ncbi:hypothetical protein BC937DRAFT_86662 [Endogone sp. FLAS-F59071]|nr:hypothetical protein BC937DRAFT_86662 [Endogone sp. FLAS-F59071]|eukprot:RUS19947.1 hypothetical protein BC937DRAFT_86662 [Endogone sp. FLAS-F59071]
MSCPHVAIAHLTPPSAFTEVHKEECTQCFDSQDSENGIDVCLSCFNAGCNDPIRHHAQTHFLKTQHPIVLNIQRVALDKPKRADDGTPPPQKISKLAIVPENEEEKYEHLTKVKCYACDGAEVERTADNLPAIIDSVLASLTYNKQSEIKAWEQEIVPCDHTRNLVQSESRKLESQSLAHCTRCDFNQNLWLCLVCGNLGCGRQQFGSDLGGNGHGLQHFEETGHAVSCKLGTITPEGTAGVGRLDLSIISSKHINTQCGLRSDVFCYSCNDEHSDPYLAQHLANWGIEVASQQKTERSMAELQLEQNLRFDFSMTLEDGKQLESLFGSGYTGLRNLGNRYLSLAEDHALTCPADSASCLQCQLSKLADGLYSGRYSSPKEPIDSTSSPSQDGVQPAMFKALVGKGHPEFSTMRQQDAYEFFQHFIKIVEQKERASGEDPTRVFQFQLEQRLQCTSCRKVRYQKQVSKDVQVMVPARIKTRTEGEANESGEGKKEVEYEEVSFEECLDTFIAEELMDDYLCPNCLEKTTAVK